ncbi:MULTISPECIES: DUF1902 domain-containing protein [Serratia]|jgi:hypothetical protein|uniref:Domain of uncharacterized function (DUF1902) n=1 Tax=Serratia quinivorans TaxID=137545 RepID=A0A379YTM8_9GAMM|nr:MULTISPECIES: DUF1902 domain-containing protein [Serratia]RYM60952.1 hypothetical protein BSR03_13490 [Serratia proteamaculans]CAI1756188.1 Domain of uncharacterised function (DUF1902) [Serratia quinivorans]SUI49970.1 Domain of uncharacterised function (DUF1902) [Serratia quinivorans]
MNKNHVFTVMVSHEDRMWTGICDELGLVTEAKTFARLAQRVHDIAPELGQLNCDLRPDEVQVEFVSDKSSSLPFMA